MAQHLLMHNGGVLSQLPSCKQLLTVVPFIVNPSLQEKIADLQQLLYNLQDYKSHWMVG